MSEREYFSGRNLIPGSTFLLLILAYNIFPLYGFLRTSQIPVSLFGAILAVIGSPTLGFLVSQFWWKWFGSSSKAWEIGGGAKLLSETISLKNDGKENQRNVLTVYNYILHKELQNEKEMGELGKFGGRRYDNYVLLSCANLGLIWGALLGIASRLSAHWLFNSFPAFSLKGNEFLWLIIVSVAAGILILLIWDGAQRVGKEHKDILEAIINTLINDSKIDENTLRKIFPAEYFKEKPVLDFSI